MRKSKPLVATKVGPPNDAVAIAPTTSVVRSNTGVSSKLITKLRYAYVNNYTDATPFAQEWIMNSLYQPNVALPNFSYFGAYGKFYNFYRVTACKVEVTVSMSSIGSIQPIAIVLIPMAIKPSDTFATPVTVTEALTYPLAKVMYLDPSTSTAQRKMSYYINFKALSADGQYAGPDTVGQMPSVSTGGGSSPTTQFWMFMGAWSTSNDQDANLEFDYSWVQEDYVTLFSVSQQSDETVKLINSPEYMADHPDAVDPIWLDPMAPTKWDDAVNGPPPPLFHNFSKDMERYRKDLEARYGPKKEPSAAAVDEGIKKVMAKTAPPAYRVRFPVGK